MIRMPFPSLAVVLCSAISAFGASSTFDLTVAAGPHERQNVPVRVPVLLGRMDKEKITCVTLTGPDGKAIPAQLTRPSLISGDKSELHFIVPHLPAGEAAPGSAVVALERHAAPLQGARQVPGRPVQPDAHHHHVGFLDGADQPVR